MAMGYGSAMEADRKLAYDEWPFYWITRAHNRYIDALGSALAGTGLDATMWRITMILKQRGWMSVSELATQANAKLSTMTKATKRMEAAGLVQLRPSIDDRRVTEVCLTTEGEMRIDRAVATARHIYNRAFGTMDPERIKLLTQLLGEVAENLR